MALCVCVPTDVISKILLHNYDVRGRLDKLLSVKLSFAARISRRREWGSSSIGQDSGKFQIFPPTTTGIVMIDG